MLAWFYHPLPPRHMLQSLREDFEFWACVLGLLTIRISAIYWLVVLTGKFFLREPLLYSYTASGYTQETIPVAAVLLVQAVSLVYQLLTRTACGRAADSFLLLERSPWIAVVSTIVFWMWVEAKPAPGSSYLPLAALTAVSILCSVVVRWGPMSRDSHRARAALRLAGPQDERGAVARVSRSTRTFAHIAGHQQVKDRLLGAARAVLHSRPKRGAPLPRNGVLLYGEPGNGKTMFAEALAGEMRLPLLSLSYSDVASKWVGEKTSRVRQVFEEAVRQQPCVLFLDEVDSFLESRENTGPGTVREDRDLVNALLTLMVDVRQSRVLLMAATNHMERLDPAAVREGRFDFKVEVPSPDLEARKGLLREGIARALPGTSVAEPLIDSVARRWNGYSSKRILAVIDEVPAVLRASGHKTPDLQDFVDALRAVQGHAAAPFENVRSLAELVLPVRTRHGLENMLGRMADPERTERLGGTLPTGVLFYGPPGTGKTAAAKAIAKHVGWTFLTATGAELSRDISALEKIYRKAMELRPAIVFVDEADELLRNREYSAATQATNKLLTLMDGAADRVRDIVWIAATNHVDQIDGALLRGGRFSEKIPFELPSEADLQAHIGAWLNARDLQLERGFNVCALVGMMGSVSIATAEAVVQSAVNIAIGRGTPVLVLRQDTLHAIDLVMG